MLLVISLLCLVEKNLSGACGSWLSQYPIFQATHKNTSELIQTCYFGTPGMTNPQRALHVLTTEALPYRED